VTWSAPARAEWVERLVAVGRALGDDGRSLLSLEAEEMKAAARRTTGLEDFGDDWFEEPLLRLSTALDDEARLHLPGRLRARAELQVLLQNRLRLVELWNQRPEIPDAPVEAPIIVTGLGRSGTTFLHELLAADPDNRAPLLWEMLHTVPGGGRAEWTADEAAVMTELADREIKMMDEMVPAFTTMHENGGGLPTECIFLFAHQFSSDLFTGLYNVPSYTIWKSSADQAPAYEWHRRMLATLQHDRPGRRMVVKAPSHLSELALLYHTYPDARVVMTHRDPLRVIGSLADLMATLHWMHSDHADYATLVEFMCMGLEMQMDAVTRQRDSGELPGAIVDVLYTDLVADPIGSIESLYAAWDLPVTPGYRAALERHVAARHRAPSGGGGSGGAGAAGRAAHDYRFEDTGLDLQTHRALLSAYQARFGVQSEV